MPVEVRALYAFAGAVDTGAGRVRPRRSQSDDPHRKNLPTVSEPVARTEVRVRRPQTSEYPVANPTYRVTGVSTALWTAEGLPDVGELRVAVAAQDVAQVVEALKDLYDPAVEIEVDDQALETCFGADAGIHSFGGRALVVLLDGGSDADGGRSWGDEIGDSELAQLLCKDTALAFDLGRMQAELPQDLNAARRNEILVWGEQTVVRSIDPELRRRGWVDSMVALTALVTACRQVTESVTDAMRALRSAEGSASAQLRSLVAQRTRHEHAVTSRLDAVALSIGRPLGSYVESLVRQSRLDRAVKTLEIGLAESLRTIEVEVRLEERARAEQTAAAAGDVRTVVSVFAVVSILLSILGLAVGLASVPNPDQSRFGAISTVLSASVLVFVGAAAVALALVRSTGRPIGEGAPNRPSRVLLVRLGVAVSCGLLLGVLVVPDDVIGGVLLGASTLVLLLCATQVARLYRLRGSEP